MVSHNEFTGPEDLVSLWLDPCGEFSLPDGGLIALLSLGMQYGWQPAGTEPPDFSLLDQEDLDEIGDLEKWDGRYYPGFGQEVTLADARALGAALERALPDLQGLASSDPASATLTAQITPKVKHRPNPWEFYSGARTKFVRMLVDHCLDCAGGFWIWSYPAAS
jgi:hypothetical protein